MASQPNIVKRGSIIYLNTGKEWFQYDEAHAPLGAGAMGTVYVGRSCASGDKVAIKRVVDKYANVPSIRERAKLEASLMFRHRNLVEMLGYVEEFPDRGPIFIISKLVQGITIDQFIKQTIPSSNATRVARIVRMFYPVLDALDYIHRQDIIHMDIKPSNIMVENGCNVRLMDLGIAHVSERIGMGGSKSGLMGTPNYAAPEQFGGSGEKHDLNKTTDIYEAGVTLYELLAGSNPYQATNVTTAIKKHNEIVLPPVKNIPLPVINVLRKATDFKQGNRYQSAMEFKTALERALNAKASFPWIPLISCVSAVIFVVILLIILFS